MAILNGTPAKRTGHMSIHRPFLSLSLLLSGCLSTTGRAPARFDDDLQILASQLGTGQTRQCDEDIELNWPFTAFHKHPRFAEHKGQLILLYDVAGRNRTRTIWQPLDSQYRFLGDGIAVGHPHAVRTEDFQFISDKQGNLWTSFRFRLPDRMTYHAGIEFLSAQPESTISRTILPLPMDESVQKIWTLKPKASQNEISVVVKTYDLKRSEAEDDWSDQNTQATYRWFVVNPSTNTAEEKKSLTNPSDGLTELTFVPIHDTLEPLALAIESTTLEGKSKKSEKIPAQNVTATRMFSPKKEKTTLFQAPRALISSLDAMTITNEDNQSLLVAWVNEPGTVKGHMIQWLNLTFPKAHHEYKNLFLDPLLLKNKKQLAMQYFLPVSYYPTNLQWQRHGDPESRQENLVLTWIAALNEEIVRIQTKPIAMNHLAQSKTNSSPYPTQNTEALLTKEIARQIHQIMKRENASTETLIMYTPNDDNLQKDDHQSESGIAGQKAPELRLCLFRDPISPVPQDTHEFQAQP